MTSKTNMIWIAAMPSILLAGMAIMALAGSVAIPHTFTAGSTANADHVNENFTACETAINDNDARITALEDTPRILRGIVNEDGSVRRGSGFTVSTRMEGLTTVFVVLYDQAFADEPIISIQSTDSISLSDYGTLTKLEVAGPGPIKAFGEHIGFELAFYPAPTIPSYAIAHDFSFFVMSVD